MQATNILKEANIVDSVLRSLFFNSNIQSTLVISKSKGLNYFEISVPRHIRFAELRKKID